MVHIEKGGKGGGHHTRRRGDRGAKAKDWSLIGHGPLFMRRSLISDSVRVGRTDMTLWPQTQPQHRRRNHAL